MQRQSDNLLRYSAKIEKDIFNEKILKRNMRESKLREEDIDLIFKHLQATEKMAVAEVKI